MCTCKYTQSAAEVHRQKDKKNQLKVEQVQCAIQVWIGWKQIQVTGKSYKLSVIIGFALSLAPHNFRSVTDGKNKELVK